jgi:hypothetical protein
MPPLALEFKVQGAEKLRDLAKALKAAGRGDLRKQLTKGIRAAADPVVKDLRKSMMALPADGDTGTRRAVAKAIGVQILTGKNAGVRIRVNRRRLPAGKRGIADAFERGKIRHPVHGNREVWVTQRTGGPWFAPVARRHREGLTHAVDNVLTDITAKLEKA